MTLNIDGLGAVPVKQGDGITNLTPTQCGPNAQLALTYDAANTVFRGPAASSGSGGSGGGILNVTASAPLTSSGGPYPNIGAAYQGNGSEIQLSAGSFTANDCVKFDANGNTADAGAACGTGGGGGSATAVTSTLQPFGNLDNGYGVVSNIGTANTVRYIQFFIPSPGITFTNIKGFQPVGGNVGHQAAGVYDSTCSLIAQSGTYTGASGQQAVALPFSSVTLPAGSYYLAFTSDNGAATFFAADAGYTGYLWNFSESAATYRIFSGSNPSTTTGGTTTLPATCGTRTALQSQGTRYTPWIAIQ
jgi:hypothetical protein